MEDLEDRKRHIALSSKDIALLNPNTRTCPIFRTRRDADLTKAIYRRVPILVDETRKEGGNPWGIKFVTMFHQTNDAELFRTAEELRQDGFKHDGNRWRKGKRVFLPLYEAKMVQAYDHRAASVVVDETNWVRQGQTEPTTPRLPPEPRVRRPAPMVGRCGRSRACLRRSGAAGIPLLQGRHQRHEPTDHDRRDDPARGGCEFRAAGAYGRRDWTPSRGVPAWRISTASPSTSSRGRRSAAST